MKKLLFSALALVMALTLVACGSSNFETPNNTGQAEQSPNGSSQGETNGETNGNVPQTPSDGSQVQFPENFAEGVLYTTVSRGNMYGEIYTSQEAIEAVQSGQPVPRGTVITYVINNDGELTKYFVMEKRGGSANGGWEYQAFNPDKSVRIEEDLNRCISCHMSQEEDDYMYRLEQMLSAELS
ncbi:cytochrome P460 family protein [Paenibacillus sp. Dod16]|uniref:cytochrome P460 family protein n=1 Tax=Paenibacillus sp. Dod16 TaxID=3416392 RepID=UPI003CF8830F